MEPNKVNNCESFEGPVGSSLVTSSSLPTGIVQLSHPAAAVLPLGSMAAQGSGCLLPLSIINSGQVSTIHHQPITTEPLLLVPASALSLASTSNLSLSNSLQNVAKAYPPTSLQYGQQLVLNNVQLPLMLKPPVSAIQLSQQPLQTQPGAQSIFVLPLGTNEKTPEVKEKTSDVNSIPENISADSTYQQNQSKKWRIAHRKNKRKRRTISAICSLREKLNTRSNSSCEMDAMMPSNLGVSNKQIEKEPTEVVNGKINNTEISQIISSLPPGWHVIGFTGLDQLGGALPTPVIPTTTALNHFQMSSLNSNNSSCVKSPEIKPSLVSVNLNNASHPVASEAYDNCAVNDLTCSVKLDDIPCTHVISIKTECPEEEEAKPDSTSDEQTLKRSKEKLSSQRKSRGQDHRSEKTRHAMPANKPDKRATLDTGNSCNNIPTSYPHNYSAIPKSVSSDEQWTIVGVTSIPALPVSNVQSQSQASLGTATVTSSSSDSNPSKNQSSDQSLDTIILKIPLCPTTLTPASPRKRRRKANKTSINKHSQTASVASLLQSANAKEYSNRDIQGSSKPQEMKWTIVGLTQSSFDHKDGSVLGKKILEQKNPPALSFRTDLTGTAKTSEVPLSKASAELVLNSSLFDFVSPVQSTNPFLIQSAFNQTCSVRDIENQIKLKSCETVQSAGVSLNSDQFGLNPPQSQWKVVGVAPLGVPGASVTSFPSLAQLTPLSPVVSVPFLIPSTSNVSLPCMSTISSCTSTSTSTVALSASSSTSNTSSDCPVINLPKLLSGSNPMMPSITPLTHFTSTSAADLQTLQNLANQHSLDQIIQNNLANFQNPINVLKINEANQWNVVGVVANNQVSLINTNSGSISNQINIDQNLISDESPQDLSMKPTSTYSKAEDSSYGEDQITTDRVKNSTIRQSLPSKSKSSDPESKLNQFKCKDMIKRHQESVHMKKNTVSSLLRLKRMQKGVRENANSEDGEYSHESSTEFYETSCESEPNKTKTRSLRSYSGNRSLFTKSHKKDSLENINLRSGTLVPSQDYRSSEEDEMVSMTNQTEHSLFKPLVSSVTEEKKQCESSTVKVEAHSAARKRKLKVPRRMVVADLDYHPFDSSSDSN